MFLLISVGKKVLLLAEKNMYNKFNIEKDTGRIPLHIIIKLTSIPENLIIKLKKIIRFIKKGNTDLTPLELSNKK